MDGQMLRRVLPGLLTLVALMTGPATNAGAQTGAKNGEWRDLWRRPRQHALLAARSDQRGNFNKLAVAWRFKTDNLGAAPRLQPADDAADDQRRALRHGRRRAATPWRIDARDRRAALDVPARRRQARATRRRGSCPAAASATGPTASGDERIFFVTIGLPARRRSTPRPACRVADFGKNGIVDLKKDNDQVLDPITGEIGLNARAGRRQQRRHRRRRASRRQRAAQQDNAKGYVRGFDVRTGKRLWIFHTIPQPGEFGNDTWENDSWSYTGNTGVWAQITRRRRARHRLPAGRDSDRRLLRRPSARQQPVRREPRRGRPEDRQAHLALPARPPRHLGLRHPVRADPGRHHGQRPADQGGGAADQAGLRSTCSIARPASRSGRSKSGRSRRARCRASGTRRRSRFRPSRRRSSARASR